MNNLADRFFQVFFAVCILTVATVPPVYADDEYCSEDWACAGYTLENGSFIHYWVENRKPYPLTITLKLSTANLQTKQNEIRQRWEFTTVLQGNERKQVVQFKKIEPKKPRRHHFDFNWVAGDMNAQHDTNHRYQLPFEKASDYRVVQGFGGGYSHYGASKYALDFAMPIGTPVHAARAGVVIDLKERHWTGGASREFAKYANFVVILHSDGTTGEYYHLKHNGVVVNVGDKIEAGQHIGYSGNTGFSSLPHLHFAVYRARSHGKYQSVPVAFEREPNTWRRRGLGRSE